ncbi:MAG: tol-pal system protein YbgF [Gammaproteobacteria bacterium]
MADKCAQIIWSAGLGLILASSAWAALPDVETVPLNQPSIGERLSAESSLNAGSLKQRVDALQAEVQELRGLVEEQSHLIQQLTDKQKTLYLDLDKRIPKGQVETGAALPTTQVIEPTAEVQLEPIQPVTANLPSSPLIQNESTSYKQAFDLIQAKDYTNAIKSLESYLAQYPNGQYTPNVYYWLGEVSLVVKNFEQASVNFHKVLDYYPLHAKAPDSLLKLGYVSYERGNLKEASQFFQDVQNRFPETSAARLAGSKLQQMRQAGQI